MKTVEDLLAEFLSEERTVEEVYKKIEEIQKNYGVSAQNIWKSMIKNHKIQASKNPIKFKFIEQ